MYVKPHLRCKGRALDSRDTPLLITDVSQARTYPATLHKRHSGKDKDSDRDEEED